MYIHNASFMIEREREGEFISWLRPRIAAMTAAAQAPRLSAMREAGGVDYTEAEAQSVAFQVEFESIEEAKKWSREVFADVAAEFEAAFGPQALVFTSIFETL